MECILNCENTCDGVLYVQSCPSLTKADLLITNKAQNGHKCFIITSIHA